MTDHFKATLPGLLIEWDGATFSGPEADELNAELARRPGQTCTPKTLLAREVLLDSFPQATISDYSQSHLAAVPTGALD